MTLKSIWKENYTRNDAVEARAMRKEACRIMRLMWDGEMGVKVSCKHGCRARSGSLLRLCSLALGLGLVNSVREGAGFRWKGIVSKIYRVYPGINEPTDPS